VPLAEDESVIVGRASPADVAIRDVSLSRQHACFEVIDGKVWVEDLHSTNGTWINGDRIERQMVGDDDELNLGATMATVRALGAIETEAFGLVSHDQLLRLLDVEVERARTYGRSLALLMVRSAPRSNIHLGKWVPFVRSLLRPFEQIALYSSTTVEIIVPEGTEDRSVALAEKLAAGIDPLLCGVGLLTESTKSADGLLEIARGAVQRATRQHPVQVYSGPSGQGESPDDKLATHGIVAESSKMKKLFATIGRLTKSSIPVLIQGETGTGKEVIARAIHDGGKRRDRPLIAINCGALPPQLVEATLFGHERGAFTGAHQAAKGVFESADGGSVLLDEVGELPLPAQAALLRVLESQRITRVGSTKEIEVDVRLIAATHRDLRAMSDSGEFRQDLLYRLDALALRVPPLRERHEDIEPLVRLFIAKANEANECEVQGIGEDAVALLRDYEWPGNIRELRNTIERAVVIAQGSMIEVADLPERVRRLEPSSRGLDVHDASGLKECDDDLPEVMNLKAEVQRYEALLIEKVLKRVDWDRKAAANSLGLPLRTLAHKILLYDLKH
jgi:DNA-binding NtrC family response regulator